MFPYSHRSWDSVWFLPLVPVILLKGHVLRIHRSPLHRNPILPHPAEPLLPAPNMPHNRVQNVSGPHSPRHTSATQPPTSRSPWARSTVTATPNMPSPHPHPPSPSAPVEAAPKWSVPLFPRDPPRCRFSISPTTHPALPGLGQHHVLPAA